MLTYFCWSFSAFSVLQVECSECGGFFSPFDLYTAAFLCPLRLCNSVETVGNICLSVFRQFVTQSLRTVVCSSGKRKCAVDSICMWRQPLLSVSCWVNDLHWRCADVLLLEVDAQNDLGNLNQPDFKVNFWRLRLLPSTGLIQRMFCPQA